MVGIQTLFLVKKPFKKIFSFVFIHVFLDIRFIPETTILSLFSQILKMVRYTDILTFKSIIFLTIK